MKIVEDAKQAVKGVAQAAMEKAVQMAPDGWMPGGRPDPLIRERHGFRHIVSDQDHGDLFLLPDALQRALQA